METPSHLLDKNKMSLKSGNQVLRVAVTRAIHYIYWRPVRNPQSLFPYMYRGDVVKAIHILLPYLIIHSRVIVMKYPIKRCKRQVFI